MWCARLSELACSTEAWYALLSPGERATAARLYRPLDQQRAILGRGWLRLMLGNCIEVAPRNVCFEVGAYGKLCLAMEHQQALAFSISHSGDLILMALASVEIALGVDVEQHRPMADIEVIAKQYFHPQEVQALESLAIPDRQKAFFDCWTCKEAVVKAVGLGLAQPLSTFRLWIEDAPGIVRIDWMATSAETREPWFVQPLPLVPGYSAAVAARGVISTEPQCWHFRVAEAG